MADQRFRLSKALDADANYYAGKVVSVRLSLLADILKGRDWVPATLDSIGGLEGIGISFLEETFASSRADARHRAHQEAVRGVLRALLPDSGTDIKGSMRSEEQLLEASGYANRRQAFQDLLRILDGELRLLTPTDPEGHGSQSTGDAPPRSYYQLTHDYLVPSLREWLTRKQRETKTGRAELKLAERASVWHNKPENRNLPTAWEWLTIRRLTDSTRWKPHEKATMQRAGKVHATRAGLITTFGILLLLGGLGVKRWNDARLLDRDATNLVSSIESADYAKLPELISQLDPVQSNSEDETSEVSDAASESENSVINLSAPIYFTMIVFPGGEFTIGDPDDSELVEVAGPIAVSDRSCRSQMAERSSVDRLSPIDHPALANHPVPPRRKHD